MRFHEFLGESQSDDDLLRDMMSRANMEAASAWMLENGATQDDLEDPESLLGEFAYWLEQERAIRVSDGCVTFYKLWDDTAGLIGDLPIILYHFTAEKNVKSIRQHGIESGRASVNRTSNPGVYLTTETSGKAVDGYIRNASKGGAGVCISVKTYLADISPDEDDADIASGETQFVIDHVSPDMIVGIDRA